MQIPTDSLRAVLDSVFSAPAYGWVEQPSPLAVLREWWGRLADWIASTRILHPLLFQIFVFVLATILVAILVHAGYVFQQTIKAAARSDSKATPSSVTLRRDATWYLTAADQAAAAGRHRDALRLAFEALVLRLDAMGSVRWGPGKTARDYSREARLLPVDRERLGGVVGVLYRHVYSGAPCGASEYAVLRGAAAGDWHAAPR
jgi:Domain of unknown function (DUF4129)